jgi:hypothetical protein
VSAAGAAAAAHTVDTTLVERVKMVLAVVRIQIPCTVLLLSGTSSGDCAAPRGRAVSSRIQ